MRSHRPRTLCLAAAMAVGLAACGETAHAPAPSGEAEQSAAPHSSQNDGNTPGQPASGRLHGQLQSVQGATQRYDRPAHRDRDYVRVSGPVPGMGFHFLRRELIDDDGNFDWEEPPSSAAHRTNPEMLVYDRGFDRLVSVEWAVPVEEYPDGPPDLFVAGDQEEDGWHVHVSEHEIQTIINLLDQNIETVLGDQIETVEGSCNYEDGRQLYFVEREDSEHIMFDIVTATPHLNIDWNRPVSADDCPDIDGTQLALFLPPVWTLHAWVHLENPDGVFAPTNPDNVELP